MKTGLETQKIAGRSDADREVGGRSFAGEWTVTPAQLIVRSATKYLKRVRWCIRVRLLYWVGIDDSREMQRVIH